MRELCYSQRLDSRETLRAEQAFYDGIREEVILRENVRAKNENNLLQGENGIVPLKDGEVLCL